MDDLPAVVRGRIDTSLPGDVATRLLAEIRPAVSLAHAPAGASVRSRLGGGPLLEPDDDWPEYLDDPLAFLAVLDLAELAALSSGIGVPATGLLNFFFDAEQSVWGFDPSDRGAWRVIQADPSLARERETPAERVASRRIGLTSARIPTFPGWEEPIVEWITANRVPRHKDDGYIELEDELARLVGLDSTQPKHRVGGWPDLEQAPWQLECQLASHGIYVGNPAGYADPRRAILEPGAADWVMLAQFDSDDEIGWMWGDVGKLYFAIRRQDLAAGAFDQAWMVLQCG